MRRIFLITLIIIFSKLNFLYSKPNDQVIHDALGFMLGGFTNTDFNEKWSTQFEIYFINKGSFKAAKPSAGIYNQFYFNINYIEVHVAIRYHHEKFIFEKELNLKGRI